MNHLTEVHWHEGMFLRPHHLQAAFRDLRGRLHQESERVRPWSYGVAKLEVNLGLLSQYELEVTSCEVLFPSGEWVCVPDNAYVDRRGFREILEERKSRLDVWLGIPRMMERDPNVVEPGQEGADGGRRYRLRESQAFDENTGTNPQTIQLRCLNAQLFFEGESQAGFEVVKIGRIHPTGSAKSLPTLDAAYSPPVLSLESWDPLYSMVREAAYAVRQSSSELAAQVARREVAIASEATGGVETAMKLQVLHRSTAVLHQMIERPRFHPQEVYLELCRVVADLSIFAPGHALGEDLPVYDHEDVGACFAGVIDTLHNLLEVVFPRAFQSRLFEERGENLECLLETEWLEVGTQFFIGVKSERPAEEVRGFMDPKVVKVASPLKIVRVVRGRLRGIDLQPVDRLPPGLPDYADVQYFRLARADHKDEFWESVAREKTVAIAGAPREQGIEYWLYVLLKAARPKGR